MLPTLLVIFLLLGVLVVLPHMNPTIVVDDDAEEEPTKLRMKPTRQR